MLHHLSELDPRDTYHILYQYIVNHQLQAMSIANHLGTMSAMVVSYESQIETVCIFCQTIDYTNCKAVQEKNYHKSLQADFQKTEVTKPMEVDVLIPAAIMKAMVMPKVMVGDPLVMDALHDSTIIGCLVNNLITSVMRNIKHSYICERVSRGKLQAHNADTDATTPTVPPMGSSVSIPHAHALTPSTPDASSTVTGIPTYPTPSVPPRSASMALVSPSPPLGGTTTSPQMDTGPNTLLRQLMSNASTPRGPTPHDDNTPIPRRHINHVSYCITTQDHQAPYPDALMDSGANGGMAGFDTCLLATVPHANVNITGTGRDILQRLPLVQCVSVVDTIDEGPIILILSQYAHKPNAKTIHSKSQVEHFRGIVYNSVLSSGGQQMVVTHEGYAIPLHVHERLHYIDMRAASDDELNTLPHIFLTTDAPWNPSIMDEEFFVNHQDFVLDIPAIQQCHEGHDPHVDSFGAMHSVSLAPSDTPIMKACHEATVEDLTVLSQKMQHHLPDLDALLPNFRWASKDWIHTTLEKTTQHYHADKHVPMGKHFHTRFPAVNIRHLPKWYSTDTFISDLPACDDGVTGHGGSKLVEIYGSLDSESHLYLTGFYPKFKNPSGLVLM